MSSRNPEIQILRAVAALFVVIVHLVVLAPAWIGISYKYAGLWAGVDLFLVISGYVITRSLYPLLDTTLSIRNRSRFILSFACRRFFRLMPAASFWILTTLALALYFGPSRYFASHEQSIYEALAALFQYFNIYWPISLAQFADKPWLAQISVFSVYWSLSLEEQFYVVAPIFLVLCPQRLRYPLLLAFLIGLASMTRSFMSISWNMRCDGLIMGVMLALYMQHCNVPAHLTCARLWLLRLISFAGVCGLLLISSGIAHTWFASQSTVVSNLWITCIPLCAVFAVAPAALNCGVVRLPGWLSTVMEKIGDRSYALYLVHFPVYLVIASLPGVPSLGDSISARLGLIAAAILITFGLAELTWRFIETPCRSAGASIASRFVKKM
jgi:peptidoglycan/LPS O-acetylase OafA/YrhL